MIIIVEIGTQDASKPKKKRTKKKVQYGEKSDAAKKRDKIKNRQRNERRIKNEYARELAREYAVWHWHLQAGRRCDAYQVNEDCDCVPQDYNPLEYERSDEAPSNSGVANCADAHDSIPTSSPGSHEADIPHNIDVWWGNEEPQTATEAVETANEWAKIGSNSLPTEREEPRVPVKKSSFDAESARIIERAISKKRSPQSFRVSAGELRWYSGYFDACLRYTGFAETQEQYIHLPEEDPRIFALFLRWMRERRFFPKAEHDEVACDWATLVDLWLFGDRRHIPMLQNAVHDLFLRKMGRYHKFFPPGAIRKIWTQTLPGSKIRQFLLHWLDRLRDQVRTGEIEWWTVEFEHAINIIRPAELLRRKEPWRRLERDCLIEFLADRCLVWDCFHVNEGGLQCAEVKGHPVPDWHEWAYEHLNDYYRKELDYPELKDKEPPCWWWF